MKVTLIGNCQMGVVRRIMELILPDADAVHIPASKVISGDTSVLDAAGMANVCIVQNIPGLLKALEGVVDYDDSAWIFPVVYFRGFHPDCIYLNDRKATPLFEYDSKPEFNQ